MSDALKTQMEQSVRRNLAWFERSGVMLPADGTWGVGERIVLHAGNDSIGKTREVFPVYTDYGDYSVLEHRRPDCNFQTALLFLSAGDYFKDERFHLIGENIFNYLYCKSGLRCAGEYADVWNWFNPLRRNEFWFDDNGWIAAFEIFFGKHYPAFDKRFDMVESGRRLADKLRLGLERSVDSLQPVEHGKWPDPEEFWLGEIRQPHWGTPVCVALLLAGMHEPVLKYHQKLDHLLPGKSLSECCYALISASSGFIITGEPFYRDQTNRLLDRLLASADTATGNVASEHCEAPAGANLVDLIYTMNWFFAGLPPAINATGRTDAKIALKKIIRLLIHIQDISPDDALKGCWRGMYDLNLNQWGGGNRYEGGAGSIYTGWTNAPIALGMLTVLNQKLFT